MLLSASGTLLLGTLTINNNNNGRTTDTKNKTLCYTHIHRAHQTDNRVHADTHTHWEEEARPHAGIDECHDAQREVNGQDGR